MSSPTRRPFLHVLVLCCGLALPSLHCSSEDGGDDAGEDGANDTPAAMPASNTSGDTWNSYAQGFFASYCVSCHNDDNAGVAARDLHLRAAVDDEADEIACGVSKSMQDWSARGCRDFPPARQFPVGSGPKPSDAERDRLLAWIDAGRP